MSAVNLDKPQTWKADITQSVDMYNDWFMKFAPKAFRETRIKTTKAVEDTLHTTANLTNIKPAILRKHPEVLATLRMSTCPPIAVDRLIGLAGVSSNLVKTIEEKSRFAATNDYGRGGHPTRKNRDRLLRRWPILIFLFGLNERYPATEAEIHRAATIVADRLCGAVANPIIRNAREKRQLARDQGMA